MSGGAPDGDPYAIVLADLLRRRDELDAAIRAIEQVRGAKSADASELSRNGAQSVDETGAYLGLSIAEAVKKLLTYRRRPMGTAEIVEALRVANYPMTAAEPSNVIGSVLSRRFDTVGDVVRIARGQWGLVEWYPNRSFRKKEKEPTRKENTPPEVEIPAEDEASS